MNKSLSDIILNSGDNDAKNEDDQLEPLSDEIDLIIDPKIKSFVKSVLLRASPFWASASSVNAPEAHPPDEDKPGGLVLHTKRVVRAVRLLMQTYDYSTSDRDNMIAAALLHDCTKAIWANDERTEIVHDILHPYTLDTFIEWCIGEDTIHADSSRYHTLDISIDTIQSILRLVRCSHGPWSPIPETIPVTSTEKLLHIADLLASNIHNVIDGPVPQEYRWIPPSS